MAWSFPRGLVILSGSSYPQLAESVARRVGVSLCEAQVFKTEDNESHVEIQESIRGKDVFIIQTGCGSVNDVVMELLIMCYACKTSSARKIIGVIPYLPYCKQSKMRKRGCITAKLFASMLSKAGMSHLITLDLYHKEIHGFFDFPIDNLRASPLLVQFIKEQVPDYQNAVIVARYPGVTRRANAYAERLRLGLAVMHGEPKDMVDRELEDDVMGSPPPADDIVETDTATRLATSSGDVVRKEKPPLAVVGDVHGKIAIMIDDMVDEVDQVIASAKCLKERGAYKIYLVATHGILSSNAPERLQKSDIDEVLVTNTIPHSTHESHCSKIRTIDTSLLLAEAIRRIYYGESMSQLFQNIPMED